MRARTMSCRGHLLLGSLLAVVAWLTGFSPEASGLTLTGTLTATATDGSGGQVFFNCDGQNPCRGIYADEEHDPSCSNILGRVDTLVISGLNLSAPGTISGTVTLSNLLHNSKQANADGSCAFKPTTHADGTFAFTGNWNGSSATLAFPGATDESGQPITITGSFSAVSQTFHVTGSLSGTGAQNANGQVTFDCTGPSTCTGSYTAQFRDSGCSNAFTVSDTIAMVGLNLSQPGTLSGRAILRNLSIHDILNPDGTCSISGLTDATAPFSGSWNGTSGTLTFVGSDFNINGGFTATPATLSTSTSPPVFPMTVTADIGPTTSNASAQIQYRPQDVGTSGSVYVFALAPATIVRNASTQKAAFLGTYARGTEKDLAVQCVLAQLNASGQLQATSAASLTAYITGLFTSLGQAVPILNNVSTPNIAGATFYVGYGSSSTSMINNGINNRALSVSGSVTCNPQPPQTGWWWNTAEGGRGYSIEVAGNHLFWASYLYDTSGRATWYVASGSTSLDGSLFVGNLEAYSQGQTLSGAYKAPTPAVLSGSLTLAFSDASHGIMIWPGGTVPVERFNVVPGGLGMRPQLNQPESGWWWNPNESGRGYFLEWQGGELFMAGYMYDDNGSPIWYLSTNTTPSSNLLSFSGTWWQYANGQTLTGAYKAPQQVNTNVAPVTITFQDSSHATMTLPGGRTTNITRFRF